MADMRLAAQEDRDLNQKGSPAIKKLSMMPAVRSSLGKTYEFEDCYYKFCKGPSIHYVNKRTVSGSFLQQQLMIANYQVKKFVRKSK